jgi:hypothetical protein
MTMTMRKRRSPEQVVRKLALNRTGFDSGSTSCGGSSYLRSKGLSG